jgi:hypothetical protein
MTWNDALDLPPLARRHDRSPTTGLAARVEAAALSAGPAAQVLGAAVGALVAVLALTAAVCVLYIAMDAAWSHPRATSAVALLLAGVRVAPRAGDAPHQAG